MAEWQNTLGKYSTSWHGNEKAGYRRGIYARKFGDSGKAFVDGCKKKQKAL
jgi:hypothetical protein